MNEISPSTKLINVFKPIGATPLDVVTSLKKKYPFLENQKMGYAGRLDPMAQGVLLVMVGEECKKRDKYQQLPKTYEFDLFLGAETDTYDALGRIVKTSFENAHAIANHDIESAMQFYLGEFNQEYPPFSSYHINGKPLFAWAKEGRMEEIEIPVKKVFVGEISIQDTVEISPPYLLSQIKQDISTVRGDFRQEEIVHDWESVLSSCEKGFKLRRIRVEAESGVYIRSIAHNIGKDLQVGGVALRIKRLSVGNFDLENAFYITA